MRARWLAAAAVLAALGAVAPARAQYYPGGYGGYGFGGFSAASGYGQQAAGLGWLAAGQGAYNEQTAAARQMNVQTNMELNEYMYESLLIKDQRDAMAQHKTEQDYRDAQSAKEQQLSTAPTPKQIQNGEALNFLLRQLLDPRLAYAVNGPANVPIPGALVENIQFHSNADVVAMCIDDLTDAEPGPVFQRAEYAPMVDTYRKISDEINAEIAKSDAVSPATVKKFQRLLKDAYAKVKADPSIPADQKLRSEDNLKAMLGMSYMLGNPKTLEIYTAGVGQRNDITLSKLLAFMQSFNLSFGPAKNPGQNDAYAQLYQILKGVHDQVFGGGQGTMASNFHPSADRTQRPQQFFSGMKMDELDPENQAQHPVAPPPPTPKP